MLRLSEKAAVKAADVSLAPALLIDTLSLITKGGKLLLPINMSVHSKALLSKGFAIYATPPIYSCSSFSSKSSAAISTSLNLSLICNPG
jgi:hypothetical protein